MGEEPEQKRGYDPPPVKAVRTEEPQAPFGQDEPNPTAVSDETAEEHSGQNDPAPAGYVGDRDPKKDMPVMPSVPETWDEDRKDHGGDPNTSKEPPASN